jgi:hypothetical protein
MREFFRSWRRKVGVVTLGLACVFMVGWVRSLTRTDEIIVPGRLLRGSTARYLVFSSSRGIGLEKQWSNNVGADYSLPEGSYQSYPHALDHHIGGNRDSGDPIFDVRISLVGFVFEDGHSKHNGKARGWYVPYWSIVLHLTLVSAFLLLSKPRKLVPKNAAALCDNNE